MKKCRLCKSSFVGRPDKIFCTVVCKSSYHKKLNKVTQAATRPIDRILHRNRSILLELLGKNQKKKKIPLYLLHQKKFNFQLITRYHKNKQGKMFHYVYDFAYMIFSDAEVLIIRV